MATDLCTLTVIFQCCGFAGAAAAPFLARYVGRKTLLACSFGASTICYLIVGTLNEVYPTKGSGTSNQASGQTLVAMVCIFIAVRSLFSFTSSSVEAATDKFAPPQAYNVSIGPLAWSVAAELPSNRLRSLTFGFSMMVGFIAAWLTGTSPFSSTC